MINGLILNITYGAKNNTSLIRGNGCVTVNLFIWLFPIFVHKEIIRLLREKGLKDINITSVLRSYR